MPATARPGRATARSPGLELGLQARGGSQAECHTQDQEAGENRSRSEQTQVPPEGWRLSMGLSSEGNAKPSDGRPSRKTFKQT